MTDRSDIGPAATAEEIHLARQRRYRLKPIPASTYLGHVYTVDVYLHSAEPYPCILCGLGRMAHEEPING